ncbi:MAG: penicillin-binding protein 2 [Clostridia bacterium]|nr:penicillin-binding protein 2 [Clostridia bacterium]
MKELRRNMRFVGMLILICFLITVSWFGYTTYTQGSVWASDIHNTRSDKTTALRGDITDRDGNVLATTLSDGTRKYAERESARRALSQTVGDTAGMSGTGVEAFFAGNLLQISTSIRDRLTDAITNTAGSTGGSVSITVDALLQTAISASFPEGYRGAACVINYKTGEILAMVSLPDYDPEAISNRQQTQVEDTAYLNRCLQGLYMPGSTFKIVTLASALEYDPNVINQMFTCSGTWEYPGGFINCMSGRTAHGDITLEQAFQKSCNVTFGKLAYQLGVDRLRQTAEQFGFNENFKFGDFMIYNSRFPESVEGQNGIVWAGIGQGDVLVTPLHMAMIAGSVANGGAMMQPYLVKKITSADGVTVREGASSVYRQVMREDTANLIAKYMYETVESGTASRARISGYTVCGKTGSAETSDDKTKATDSWFTGFIYDDDHPYAVAVVVEEGGAGGQAATVLGRTALEYAIQYIG